MVPLVVWRRFREDSVLGGFAGGVNEASDGSQEEDEGDEEANVCGGLCAVTEDAEAVAGEQQAS